MKKYNRMYHCVTYDLCCNKIKLRKYKYYISGVKIIVRMLYFVERYQWYFYLVKSYRCCIFRYRYENYQNIVCVVNNIPV